jgi:hypothetical protein
MAQQAANGSAERIGVDGQLTMKRHLAPALVCAAVLLGGWLRLSGLEARSISHPEMYVPGIRLPAGISEPSERLTVRNVLTGTFSSDTHPPGYYLLMLPWTRQLGTSLLALRLPSALLGIACIPLLYLVGVLLHQTSAGAFAAVLLALNGYHIFWSQVARMFSLACFLGLLSTVLLLLIAREAPRTRLVLAAYVFTVLCGLTTHIFFWALLAAQMCWAFANAKADLWRGQLLTAILGSPLIAFAAYQSATTVADLSANALEYLLEFLPFAFLWPTAQSGFFPSAIPLQSAALRIALLVIAAILAISGLRALETRSTSDQRPISSGFWHSVWLAGGVLATLAILLFVYSTRQLPAEYIHPTISITKLLVGLPLLLAAVAIALDRLSPRVQFPSVPLIPVLAFAPILILALVSQFRPLLNQRGLLFAAPYLLLLLSVGLLALGKIRWLVAVPVLAACAVSPIAYSRMMVDPADYHQFAAAVQSEIQTNDLVFVRKAWYETPIFYYLSADRFRLVGRDYEAARFRNPDSRVWVVLLYDPDPAYDMKRALSGYQSIKTIVGPHMKAILYRP